MARDEVKTDSWVRDLLKVAKIPFTEQGGGTKELDNAFKTASKSLSGNAGYPDFLHLPYGFLESVSNRIINEVGSARCRQMQANLRARLNGSEKYDIL